MCIDYSRVYGYALYFTLGLIEFSFHLSVELSTANLPLEALVKSLSALLLKAGHASPSLKPHHVVTLGWLLLHHLSSPHITASLLALGGSLLGKLGAYFISLFSA